MKYLCEPTQLLLVKYIDYEIYRTHAILEVVNESKIMFYCITYLSIFSNFLCSLNALNIVALFLFPTRSPVVTFQPLFKRLTEDGHNLTLISYFSLEGIEKNYKEIIIGGDEVTRGMEAFGNIPDLRMLRFSRYAGAHAVGMYAKKCCTVLFTDKAVQNLSKSDIKFDIVFLQLLPSECIYQFAKQFECPIIGVHSTSILTWTANRFGQTVNPSYIPNNFSPYSSKMNFWQRLDNTLITYMQKLYYRFIVFPVDREVVTEHFSDEEASNLDTVIYNTSIYLINTHFTVQAPQPLVPSIVEVGGIHIGQQKPLPKVDFNLLCISI